MPELGLKKKRFFTFATATKPIWGWWRGGLKRSTNVRLKSVAFVAHVALPQSAEHRG
jgi:hypothetical protein